MPLIAIGAIALAVTAWLSPSAALAAFPGSNGRIAYAATTGALPSGAPKVDIFTILPDGSGLQQLTDDSAIDDSPSWSADGRRLVVIRTPEGAPNGHIVVANDDGGAQTQVFVAGNPTSPSFSPSGDRILYAAQRAIRTIRTDGTAPRRVLTLREFGGYPSEPQYSPNGRRIVFKGDPKIDGKSVGGLWSMRRNGTHLRRLTKRVTDYQPDYSPEGRHIIFLRYKHGASIRVMRADGSRRRAIPNTGSAGFPAYSPAGERIVVAIASSPLTGSCSDLYTMSPSGADLRVVTDYCDGSGFQTQAGSCSWQPLPPSP